MSAPKKFSIKIVYQTNLGEIRVSRSTGSNISVEFLNSPSDSFEISTFDPIWQIDRVSATAWDTHVNVFDELYIRHRDIQFSSASHSSRFSGELGLSSYNYDTDPVVLH